MEGEIKAKGGEKNGSVIPPKRRSVKQMIWERVIDPSIAANKGTKKKKNNNSVVVYPTFSSEPFIDY
ncbi:hypothetical protein Lal_00020682 [Lupinus albus]|uniref:Uncharacterized protein n=1 Tax=Lupinus albus TaxID=3870 RepID=A0A6A4Q5F6_LUPAL|nr:hypothetical protein Lalb_Chr08g0241011 [Lupinus albus]KAF1871887.1 hypothetical protein Lal_00020682 [Lupinus albus]